MKEWRLAKRFPIETLAFLGSIAWKAREIIFHHPLLDHLYSDMIFYFQQASKFKAGTLGQVADDFTHPPGMAWLTGTFLSIGPGWITLQALFFGMSCLIPLILAQATRMLFDLRAARFAYWASLFYPPIWQYGSFLLAELPLMFLVSSIALLSAWLWKGGLGPVRSALVRVTLGLAAGAAVSLKMTLLPCFAAVGLLAWGAKAAGVLPSEKVRRFSWSWVLLAMVLVLLSGRGTVGTGRFNLGTNKFPGDFLIGNCGKCGMVEFRGGGGTWGSPSWAMRGWTEKKSVPWSMWEGASFKQGGAWILEHPDQWASMNHFKLSAFLFDPSWPMSSVEDFWILAYISTFWMGTLGYFLMVFAWLDRVRGSKWRDWLFSRETVLLVPMPALMIPLLLVSAESRYRIPLDPLILILAGAGFSALRSRRMVS